MLTVKTCIFYWLFIFIRDDEDFLENVTVRKVAGRLQARSLVVVVVVVVLEVVVVVVVIMVVVVLVVVIKAFERLLRPLKCY